MQHPFRKKSVVQYIYQLRAYVLGKQFVPSAKDCLACAQKRSCALPIFADQKYYSGVVASDGARCFVQHSQYSNIRSLLCIYIKQKVQ